MQLLELNDQALTWYSAKGAVLQQPGSALVEGDTTLFGEPALSRARLSPRGFQDQHWQLLNSDSLAMTSPGVENNADLIYRHLQLLSQEAAANGAPNSEPLLCAVPGLVSNEQLGLFLGIAQEAGLQISSFVNSEVLHCLNEPLPGQAYCIDVQNRRGVLSELQRDANSLHCVDSQDLPQLSLNGLIDGWLDLLTDQFVARSRFDPLRVAETEQQLFDQVRAWLPQGGVLTAGVDHQGNQRAVDLSFEEVSGRAQQRYREAHSKLPARATVVLSPRAALLPGFADYLSGHGHTVSAAPSEALWSNARQSTELAAPQAVHFLTRLSATEHLVDAASDEQITATHALQANVAVPLATLATQLATLAGSQSSGFRIAAGSEDVTVNGTQGAHAAPLAPGDVLRVLDQDYLCIRVEDGPAS